MTALRMRRVRCVVREGLASLEYSLKLCRDHRTYVSLATLAFAIHHVLQDDTDALVEHLSAYATGKRE